VKILTNDEQVMAERGKRKSLSSIAGGGSLLVAATEAKKSLKNTRVSIWHIGRCTTGQLARKKGGSFRIGGKDERRLFNIGLARRTRLGGGKSEMWL